MLNFFRDGEYPDYPIPNDSNFTENDVFIYFGNIIKELLINDKELSQFFRDPGNTAES